MSQASDVSTAKLRCPTCKRNYTVPDYQATRRYKCAICKVYLEMVAETPAQKSDTSHGMAAQKDPFVGRVFGNYRMISRLGKGGMGLVYLGEHTELSRKAAVKIMTEEVSRMPGIEKRFKREATAGERLKHPNIVATLDMGREGNFAYLVTEYVDGGSLEGLLAREGKLSLERTEAMATDILTGLQYAHEQGVTHRDIKPANILLTGEGHAKVIDFGLAFDAEAETILTLQGTVMGTPSFMSPEQAQGERGGPASDQYSTGLLIWHMLAGRKPFEGRGVMEILRKQITEPLPSLHELNPEIPVALDVVVQQMTAKHSEDRYPSAKTASEALHQALHGGAPAAVPSKRASATSTPGSSGGKRVWILIAAGAGLAALALAYLLLR